MFNATRGRVLAPLALVVCLAVAACGSSSSSSSSGSSGAGASSSASSSGSASSANLTAAQSVVSQYSSKPTPFPVDMPLTKKLAAGQQIAYLDCAAPFCALLGQLYGLGTSTLKISPVVPVKADASANGIQTALSSILVKKPAAVLLPAVNLGALGGSISKFQSAGIPIVGAGVMGGQAQGISAPVNGPNNYLLHGKILADWAIVTAGGKGNIVFYGNPELDFTKVETAAFKAEMAKNCSSCTVRYVDIPVTTIGSTAPSRVVSDLQANPSTKVALFSSLETATGLPAAIKTAGIKVKIAGSAPVPVNLQDMKTGGIAAAVGLDAGILALTQIDAAVRLATKQPLTSAEKAGYIPSRLITAADLPADVSKGYSAYPDFVQRFAKLWASAK
ncbi:MAG: substrate-binding domain-containing protein [Actinomycetota bacterium]|nr:substrate-binding domain-containing protein [Actinomycetota bacterium]